MSKDPAGIEGGLNLYQYCKSNPTSYVDVTGEDALVLAIIIAEIVIVGALLYTAVTMWNPNVNPIHPENVKTGGLEILVPPRIEPLDLSFPAHQKENLLIPNPLIPGWQSVETAIEIFPHAVKTAGDLITVFPALTKSFFQNVVCTKDGVKSNTETKGGTTSKELKEVHNSIKESPKYPEGFQNRTNGTTSNKVNNQQLLQKLREIETGMWRKVYKDGYDSYGNKISIHYFQSQSGKVFDVKVKPGWSN